MSFGSNDNLTIVQTITRDYVANPVTSAAYVELDASLNADCEKVTLFDSSGVTMILAHGPLGAEVEVGRFPPGGWDGEQSIKIPKGSRLALKAASAAAPAVVGELVINILG